MSVRYDFAQPSSLCHRVSGSGVFDAVTELGRARLTIGTSNAAHRVVAPRLGAEFNSVAYLVQRGSLRIREEGLIFHVDIPTGTTAAQLAALVNRDRFNPRVGPATTLPDAFTAALRSGMPYPRGGPFTRLGADLAGGTGASAATLGGTNLAGGVDPVMTAASSFELSAAEGANAGLFVFDAEEPLVLVQFAAFLSGSVAWELTLRRLTLARADIAEAVVIAGATAASALVIDRPVVIPAGWGLGFSAGAQGWAQATVQRARS